jgi:hypothetical protein
VATPIPSPPSVRTLIHPIPSHPVPIPSHPIPSHPVPIPSQFAIPRDLFIKGFGSERRGTKYQPPSDLSGADLFVGLGWTCAKGVDLDASVLASDGNGKLARIAHFKALRAIPGVVHQGDNTTGKGSGDDERIYLDLDAVPWGIKEMYVHRSNCRGVMHTRSLAARPCLRRRPDGTWHALRL